MSVLETQNGIKYLVMQEEHKEDALDLTCEIFGKFEPAGQLVGNTPEIMKAFLVYLCGYFVKQKLSIVAIDEQSNKLVGVFTGWDTHRLEKEMGFCEGLALAWNMIKESSKKEHKSLEPLS